MRPEPLIRRQSAHPVLPEQAVKRRPRDSDLVDSLQIIGRCEVIVLSEIRIVLTAFVARGERGGILGWSHKPAACASNRFFHL